MLEAPEEPEDGPDKSRPKGTKKPRTAKDLASTKAKGAVTSTASHRRSSRVTSASVAQSSAATGRQSAHHGSGDRDGDAVDQDQNVGDDHALKRRVMEAFVVIHKALFRKEDDRASKKKPLPKDYGEHSNISTKDFKVCRLEYI